MNWARTLLIFLGLLALPAMTAAETIRPRARPELPPAPAPEAAPVPADEAAPAAPTTAAPAPVLKPAPDKGPVTNLPMPRYVSLKGKEGNARRGPGLTHRIDWVFTAPGLPLRITAEHEHWRRVEDSDGMGGWVHYSLLSGSRTALVLPQMLDILAKPDPKADIAFRAERNVILRLLECGPDWCRVSAEGEKGWARKPDLWGVDPDEILQ